MTVLKPYFDITAYLDQCCTNIDARTAVKEYIKRLESSEAYAWKNVSEIEKHRKRVEEICDEGIRQRDATIETLRQRNTPINPLHC